MKEYCVDCSKLADRESTFEYIKQLFDLPEYCGNNLDAIYDCLTEKPGFALSLEHADRLTKWGKRVLFVLSDASVASENPCRMTDKP